MNPVLQRNKLIKELEKRGNPNHPTWSGDTEVALDHVDVNYYTYPENVSILESEGILLPVPFEEMDEYIEKKAMREQKLQGVVAEEKKQNPISKLLHPKEVEDTRMLVDKQLSLFRQKSMVVKIGFIKRLMFMQLYVRG